MSLSNTVWIRWCDEGNGEVLIGSSVRNVIDVTLKRYGSKPEIDMSVAEEGTFGKPSQNL